jgi:hypothetical protein
MKKHPITCLAILLLASFSHSLEAQTSSRLLSNESYEDSTTPAKPPTTRERLENTGQKHSEIQTEIVALFNRMVTEPQIISSKETVQAIDQGDRELKKSKATFDSILSSLRADLKRIKEDSYFTDEQKSELMKNIDAMAKQCEDSSLQAAASIKVLTKSYKLMPEWRKGYRTYLDLDGEAKATQHLKAAVDEYVKELTAKPEAEESKKVTDEIKPAGTGTSEENAFE